MSKILRLGVLISGSGTNLQKIIGECHQGSLKGAAEVALVISDKEDAYGLKRAENAGIKSLFVNRDDYSDAHSFNQAIADALHASEADMVIMAGYMRILGSEVLNAFSNKVLNIHPALLPLFPGAHGIKDSFDSGMGVGGVTVHFANEVFDEGPIFLQRAVPIEKNDTIESFEAKIHAIEYKLYPLAIGLIAAGAIRVENGEVVFQKNDK